MTRGRLVAAGLVLWVLILGIALQPHPVPVPRVTHARPLDPADVNLPTLAPRNR